MRLKKEKIVKNRFCLAKKQTNWQPHPCKSAMSRAGKYQLTFNPFIMKTLFKKVFIILMGFLLLFSQKTYAATGSKITDIIGSEFQNLEGLYIIAGVVISSLVVYILFNHIEKDNKSTEVVMGSFKGRYRNTRGHRRAIRKTS